MAPLGFGAVMLLLFCSASLAAPSSNVAWTPDLKKFIQKRNVGAGQKLADIEPEDVFSCSGCHGKTGAEPDRDKYPMLAGQNAAYSFKQLKDFQSKSREHRKMYKAVRALTDDELADLAAWYASHPLPSPAEGAEKQVSDATLKLVRKGDKARLIAPCASCHGLKGEGARINVPTLAGQSPDYFVDTMRDYKRGKRRNDIYSRMRLIAQALTRDEIEELAAYYASLGKQ